jgi:hypothetical protein
VVEEEEQVGVNSAGLLVQEFQVVLEQVNPHMDFI